MDDLPQPPSPQIVMLMGTGGALGLVALAVAEAPRWRKPGAAEDVPAEEGILLLRRWLLLLRVVDWVNVDRWEW